MKLLFIPGLLSSNAVWGKLNELRSHYASFDMDINGASTIESLVKRESEKLDSQAKYCVIGVSLGGYIALELVSQYPHLVEKLVLLNTSPHSVDTKTLPDRKAAIALAKQNKFEALLATASGCCFYDKKPEYIKLEKEMGLAVGAKNYVTQQECIINRRSYAEDLKKIKCPTLVIGSKDDAVLPFADSLRLFNDIPDARLVAFSQCGHLAPIERARETFAAVHDFLLA